MSDERLAEWWYVEATRVTADLAELTAERDRLRAELAEQKEVNLKLATRLARCSAVLGRAAERGRVCECQQPDNGCEG